MTDSKSALYRLDFRTDLTSTDAPIINLGFMIETALDGGFRFLGLVSRKGLTPCEGDLVNLATWPELRDVDAYMDQLFGTAWTHVCSADPEDLRLGSEHVARQYSDLSALHFVPKPVEELGLSFSGDINDVHKALYDALVGLGSQLRPAVSATVLPFAMPQTVPSAVELPKYRAEAEWAKLVA